MGSLFRPGREIIAPLVILGSMAAASIVLTASLASAQNLDAGKSPEKLFADGCTACHRSPRGLAKGRMSLTLTWFLQDHYSAGPDTAKALAAYLQSVDTPSPAAPAKPGPKSAKSKPRPPKPDLPKQDSPKQDLPKPDLPKPDLPKPDVPKPNQTQ